MKLRNQRVLLAAFLVWVSLAALRAAAEGPHHLGAGANYFVAVENIDQQDTDEDGFGYFFSYQYRPNGPLGLEVDLEMLPDGYAGAEDTVYAPQAYVILGSYIYLAAGVGGFYTDGEFSDDPFYVFRLGTELDFRRQVYFDFYANYQFEHWDDLSASDKNIGSDTVFLGAAIRFGL